jgi:hypothetical protein
MWRPVVHDRRTVDEDVDRAVTLCIGSSHGHRAWSRRRRVLGIPARLPLMRITGRLAPIAIVVLAVATAATAAVSDRPARAPEKGCRWEKFTSVTVGLEAWVQRCDFGFRRIDFLARGKTLAIRYSDGGEPDAVIDSFEISRGESAAAAVRRVFASHTERKLASRCVLAPFHGAVSPPPGVKRYTFVPDAKYQREVDAKRDPNEVGEPPCGEWGESPDGIQYFEAQSSRGARRILFVRIGQDTPLFDEQTLRILP